jgi:hypothetical protein
MGYGDKWDMGKSRVTTLLPTSEGMRSKDENF